MKRKKLATGSLVKGVIKDPLQLITQNESNLAQAAAEAESNPFVNILNALGGLTMNYGLSMDNPEGGKGFGDSNFGKIANSVLPVLSQLATGGVVGLTPVNIEGGEVVQTPDGNLIQATGPDHSSGGINVTLPDNSMVYSKKVKYNGKSMAERKKNREKGLSKLNKLLTETPTDVLLKNTFERSKSNAEYEENLDTQLQDLISSVTSVNKKGKIRMKSVEEFAPGGRVGPNNLNPEDQNPFLNVLSTQIGNGLFGLEGLGQFLNPENIGSPGLATGIPTNNNVPELEMPTQELNMPKIPVAKNTTTSLPPGSNNLFPNVTAGDATKIGGTLFSMIAPYINTLRNRAGDTLNINPFENAGDDTINTFNQAMDMINSLRDSELMKAQSEGNALRNRLRNSSRGINSIRAGDITAQLGINDATRKINEGVNSQLMSLLMNRGNAELQRDRLFGEGERLRTENDAKDRDAYFSNLGANFRDMGVGIQSIGADMNAISQRQATQNVLNQISDLFEISQDGTLKVKDVFKR